MRKKKIVNEFDKREPTPAEIRAAEKMAKKVSSKLHGMMTAKTEKNA